MLAIKQGGIICPDETIEQVANEFFKGNKVTAKDFLYYYLKVRVLTHEILHAFGDNNLSEDFQEIGTRYYEKTVLLELIKIYLDTDELIHTCIIYEDFIKQYGEQRIHGLFFGKNPDKQLVGELTTKIAEENRRAEIVFA